MKFVNIVGVIVEANSPDEAKAVFDRAINAASHHTPIVSSVDNLLPWPCDVGPDFSEGLLGVVGDAIEDLDKPEFAIKKHEGYSELVVTKASIVHNDESLTPWPAEDGKPTTVALDAMALPVVSEKKIMKVMPGSYQRSGVVARGTLLGSGARQVTAAFPQHLYDKLKLAAEKKGVAASEMVRQCVDIALNGA
jgi:hypothetical protein